jgi:hypothetical protein
MSATHCKRGHERTPENTYKDGTCRTCKNEKNRSYRAALNTLPQPTPAEQARIDHNRRGRDNYIERRRQRLAQQEKAA